MIHHPRLTRSDLPEIERAVVIAALSALVVGVVEWGMEALRDELRRRKEPK